MTAQIGLVDDCYRRRLRSMLAVDEMVASLVEALSAAGALDNTYIVFTSDNGYLLGEHGIPSASRRRTRSRSRFP